MVATAVPLFIIAAIVTIISIIIVSNSTNQQIVSIFWVAIVIGLLIDMLVVLSLLITSGKNKLIVDTGSTVSADDLFLDQLISNDNLETQLIL